MTRKTKSEPQSRRRYTAEYKAQALGLLARVGAAAAAGPGVTTTATVWLAYAGAPRLQRDLAAQGQRYNEKTVTASLRRQGLRAKAAKKFKATTNARHNLPIAPNLLQQDFTASAPNRKWVGDIAYLWTEQGWLYLAVIIDLYSRAVVGWTMPCAWRLRQSMSLNNVSGVAGEDHTRFFQNYYLLVKFGYDKRRPHLSSLIVSGQLSRIEAIKKLNEPLYESAELESDTNYLCKKLGISRAEFDAFMKEKSRSYDDFLNWGSRQRWIKKLQALYARMTGRKISIYS